MNKNRLEAFSDGVIAIIITIMVLDIRVPHGVQLADLLPLWPKFLSYLLSFVYVGIYWNNHHHMLHAVKQVNGATLWANLNLMFWLSLMPCITAWVGESQFAPMPMAVYAIDLCLCAVAYTILQAQLIKSQGSHSLLKEAVGRNLKGKISLAGYALAIALALSAAPRVSGALLFAMAGIWLIPDSRIEKRFA